MTALVIESLFKSFGKLRLFQGLSLNVEPTKYACLLGPSGCGKSTLIRLIGGWKVQMLVNYLSMANLFQLNQLS